MKIFPFLLIAAALVTACSTMAIHKNPKADFSKYHHIFVEARLGDDHGLDEIIVRQLLDRNYISHWNWADGTETTLLTAQGCSSNNGTKATPALSADLFGDWREEVIWRTNDGKELRIYTSTFPTGHRFYTLMHDPQYRLAIAWQNVAYNQPPHPGFYIGEGMAPPPRPNIVLVGANKL